MPKPGYRGNYQRERAKLLASSPMCAYDCGRIATEADHQPPLSRHLHVNGSGCCVLVPSCYPCRQLQAAALGGGGVPMPAELEPEPAGFEVDHPVWDVGWLDGFRDVPGEGWWPRLMTVPHRRAVGSIGVEFVEWTRAELGVELRWWQQLFAVRLLEVDARGELVWTSALLTLARQCGKSLLVYCLCEWRSEQAARFGEFQLVLHTADSLEHAKAVWQQAHRRAGAKGFGLRRAAGEYEISKPDGVWLVRSQTGAVGYSASLAVADECHGIDPVTIEQRLGPTTIEKAQSQMLLVSTASSRCTEMFPMRREAALLRLGDPDNELIVEWSGPRGASVLDPIARRQASPYWHRRRDDDIRAQAERAAVYEMQPYPHDLVVGQRTQFHNEWPRHAVTVGKGVALVDPVRWATARCDDDGIGPLVVGVEDHHGEGAAVGFCATLPDGRFVLGGMLRGSRGEAYRLAFEALLSRPGSMLVVGASLFADPELVDMPVVEVRKSGLSETGPSLSLLRDLLATGRVTHDGSPDLGAQVETCRVSVGVSGLSLVTGPRTDLLRAAVWALRVAATQLVPEPAIH